jgi:hypothetical protein
MITVTSNIDGPPLTFNVTLRRLVIYLDTFALIHLAERDRVLGNRFIALFGSQVDLLFSVTNAAELAGSQGASFEAVKQFLNEIGPHWFPVEMDAFEVVKREQNGTRPGEACLAQQFLRDYFGRQAANCLPNTGSLIDIPASIRLGPILDWVAPQRESILGGSAEMDVALMNMITCERTKFEEDPQHFDQTIGGFSWFNPAMPATFTLFNLIRSLVVEAKYRAIKKGDGLDFCHAVMATAFSSVAALDKHWKRRIDNLPKPNKLAKIYYAAELDKMVTDVESWLDT